MAHFLAGGGFKTGRGKRFIVTTLLTSLASGIAGAIWGSGQAGQTTDRLEGDYQTLRAEFDMEETRTRHTQAALDHLAGLLKHAKNSPTRAMVLSAGVLRP